MTVLTSAGVRRRLATPALLRRLDHLLRLASTDEHAHDAVLAALPGAAQQVSPAVLLSALGQIRTRTARHQTRVFFPAGHAASAHVIPDTRQALPAEVVARAAGILHAEALARAAALPPVDRAIIDTGLDGLVVPFTERSAARALLTLARGSVRPVPPGRYLRLFCHWMENTEGPRVDLDLSVALYNRAWEHVGTCDYTSLRIDGAVHSGDLTSAPPPHGASEFVDLDLERLAASAPATPSWSCCPTTTCRSPTCPRRSPGSCSARPRRAAVRCSTPVRSSSAST
jgi:hypothetical protein